MPHEAEVLVDWMNIATGRQIHSEADAVRIIDDVVELVVEAVGHLAPPPHSANVRLYGSWETRNLEPHTRRAIEHLRQAASRSNRRIGKLRITVNLVRQMAHSALVPDAPAIASYVVARPCRSAGCGNWVSEQKMADTMIVSDAIFFGSFPEAAVIVISDDQDMLPGLLAASYFRRTLASRPSEEVLWFRPGRPLLASESGLLRHLMIRGSS